MTQEDKQLLLKDLCCRLPYGVIVSNPMTGDDDVLTYSLLEDFEVVNSDYPKPYLRPMSSMTEEEKKEYNKTCITKFIKAEPGFIKAGPGYTYDGWWEHYDTIASFDWLLAHHFDYHHLMEKGLALKAPEGMYETK